MTTTADLLQLVRFYTPADPYYYTVDNRPLGDLNNNIAIVADAVEASINASKVGAYTFGHLAQAVYGASPRYIGKREFPGGMAFRVNPGILITPRDISESDPRQFLQVAVNQNTVPFTCTAASTSMAKVYLVQARHVDPMTDETKPVAYFNRTSVRAEDSIFTGYCELGLVEGTEAPVGTEVAPNPDSGWYALFQIRVDSSTTNLTESNVINSNWQDAGTGGGGGNGGGSTFSVTVAASNNNPTCTYNAGGNCSNNVTLTATATGGSGTYVYTWNQVTGTTTGVTYPSGTTGSSIQVSRSANSSATCTFKVTVTDTVYNASTTGEVTVSFNHTVNQGTDLGGSLSAAGPLTCTYITGETGCNASTTVTCNATGGTGSYTYNWTASGVAIVSGQGTNQVTISYTGSVYGQYVTLQCSINDGVSTFTAEASGLQAYPIGPFSVTIPSTASDSCTYTSGTCSTNVSLTATPINGAGSLTYLWEKVSGAGSITGGQGTATVTIGNTSANSDNGVYRVRVTDGNGRQVYSNSCTVAFTHTMVASLSASAPSNVTAACSFSTGATCDASNTVTCTASGGTPPYTYNWVKLSGNGSITGGQGTDTATISRTGNSDTTGVFKCIVTDSASASVDSNNVTYYFAYTASTPLSAGVPATKSAACNYQSPPNSSCQASTTITAVPVGGTGNYTYSWTKVSGTGGITGSSTSASVVVANTSGASGAPFTGVFRCTVSDGVTTSSGNCTVTFGHTQDLAISVPSSSSTSCTYVVGQGTYCTNLTNITAAASGGNAPYTYSWARVSGVGSISSGGSSATVSVSNTSGSTGTGVFRCTVTDASSNSVSGDCTVTFTHTATVAPLVVSISGGDAFCSGTAPAGCTASRTLTASVSGGRSPYSYSWAKVSGSGTILSGTGTSQSSTVQNAFTSTGSTSGTFRCTVTDADSRTAFKDFTVGFSSNVTPQPVTVSISGSTYDICSTSAPSQLCTASVTVTGTPSGGVAPYAYSWAKISGGSTMTLVSPASQSTVISRRVSSNTPESGVFRCTITDSVGTSGHADVTITLEKTYFQSWDPPLQIP